MFSKSMIIPLFFLLIAPSCAAWAQEGEADALNYRVPHLEAFAQRANPSTGLTNSYIGGTHDILRQGASTYDMSLWAMASPYGRKIINTYANNNTTHSTESPQTFSKGYAPDGGVLSFVRLGENDKSRWWELWEWSVKAGENAWIGLAALRDHVKFGDSFALKFARERAEFLLSLQDSDGALRMGPKGQYFPYLKEGYWAIKSTENNESALYFLDQLYWVTKNDRYKQAADRIYAWLISKMLDPRAGMFHRGFVHKGNYWRLDDHSLFSPDTLTFAPIERMLNDPRFGTTRLNRLNAIGRMIEATKKKVGVVSRGQLQGISFSSKTRSSKIISPEWTAQYVLFCNAIARYYRKEGAEDKAVSLESECRNLMEGMNVWYARYRGALPYAIYSNGHLAANVKTGHGWNTPDGWAALSSTVYFSFALNRFDPLREAIFN